MRSTGLNGVKHSQQIIVSTFARSVKRVGPQLGERVNKQSYSEFRVIRPKISLLIQDIVNRLFIYTIIKFWFESI